MAKRKKINSPSDTTSAVSELAQEAQTRWNGRFSITITLVTAIGLLMLISVGSVLGVGVWLAQKNTFSLLSANAHQGMTAAVDRIKQHLKPAEHQAKFIATRIANGDVDPTDAKQLGIMLSGALAAAPQIDTVIFINKKMQAQFANHDTKTGKVTIGTLDFSNDPVVKARIANIKPGANWGDALWGKNTKKTYLNLSYPVSKNGKFIGTVLTTVTVEQLSAFVSEKSSQSRATPFILSGRDHVLAHPLMAGNYPGRTDKTPLPHIKSFKDPVLANIWHKEGHRKLGLKLSERTDGHIVRRNDTAHIFVYQKIPGFGPKPLIAGVYIRGTDVSKEIRRMAISLIAGIVALIASLLAAIYLGRKIAQPIVNFSTAAGRIRNLDISQIDPLPGSVLRELDDQSKSFNTMLRALHWFELYVPKTVVEHLVKRSNVDLNLSDDRNITVMFTDMADFSTISQGMTAHEVAELVNHHFALIGKCIDAEDGTIDKFIGDSVMAFWGAPKKQKRRAERACRAALAIAKAIRKDNKKRVSHGKPPIGIRIGIHTGAVTVGNIGAPGRINYTIIGDNVNIGQRLEQLGKKVYPPKTDVSILISGDTARDLGKGFKPVPAGKFKLKGRAGEIEIFKLL